MRYEYLPKEEIEFLWYRPNKVEISGEGRNVTFHVNGIKKIYSPLGEEPTLFIKFLSLNPRVEEILSFIKTYGTLKGGIVHFNNEDLFSFPGFSSMFYNGEPWEWSDFKSQSSISDILETLPPEALTKFLDNSEEPPRKITSQKIKKQGESLEFWRREIWDMARVFQIWRVLEEKDYELFKRIAWFGSCRDSHIPKEVTLANCVLTNLPRNILLKTFSNAEEVYEAIAGGAPNVIALLRSHLPEEVPLFMSYSYFPLEPRRKDIDIDDLRFFLWQEINSHLSRKVSPFLKITESGFEPYLASRDLLSALWLQFYFAVLGERKLKRCAVCGLWEDVTDKTEAWTMHPECGARKRSKKYYNDKVKRTRELYKEGKSIEEIASLIDRTPEWVMKKLVLEKEGENETSRQ